VKICLGVLWQRLRRAAGDLQHKLDVHTRDCGRYYEDLCKRCQGLLWQQPRRAAGDLQHKLEVHTRDRGR